MSTIIVLSASRSASRTSSRHSRPLLQDSFLVQRGQISGHLVYLPTKVTAARSRNGFKYTKSPGIPVSLPSKITMSNVHMFYLHNFITQRMSRDEDCLRKFVAHQSLRLRLPVFVAYASKQGWKKEALNDVVSHITERLAALTLEEPQNHSQLPSGRE
jgi:hypothetical protein